MLQYIKGLALLLAGKGLFFEVKKIIPKEIEDVLTKNYEPILLELHDVKWCDVEPENGTDKEHLLSLWSVAFEKNIDPRELTSWRLKNPYSGKLKIIA